MIRRFGAALIVALSVATLAPVRGQKPDPAVTMFEAARQKETLDGDLKGAIETYRKVVAAAGTNRALAAQALVRMAECYQKLGDAQAQTIYEQVVREFGDQKDAVATARIKLGATDAAPTVRGDRAVWTGPKVDLFGRVSPDGRFICYTDWSGFNNLAVHDVGTNSDRALTGNTGWFGEDPNWGEAQWSAVSPDSRQIAYAWIRKEGNEVRIIPVSETSARPPRTLLKLSDAPGVRDWSPDGRLLAIGIERGDRTTQIAVASVADGSMRVLKSNGWRGADTMFFSRDSRYLAFDLPASDDDDVDQRDVFILAVDGSREVRAVADPADDRVAGWSPDGRHLLFTSTRTGPRSLWALPVSEGRPQGRPELVKTDVGSSISLGVTTTGALYLHKYVSSRDIKIARIDTNTGTLVGQPVHFSRGLLPVPMTPHWAPDGRSLAYQVRGDEEGLAIRSVETGEVRKVRSNRYVPDPRWSPDGRSVITNGADGQGRSGILRIDVASGRATLIVHTEGLGAFPRWSADGTKIFYVGRRPFIVGDRIIRERDLQSGVEREIFKHPLLRSFEVSPDGRYLAFQTAIDPTAKASFVLLVPVAGGAPRELLRIPASETIENARPILSWTPDSRSVLIAKKSPNTPELTLIDIETGTARRLAVDVRDWTLAEGAGPAGGFSLSPDGKSIAFLMGKSGAEVWALENFLPKLAKQP